MKIIAYALFLSWMLSCSKEAPDTDMEVLEVPSFILLGVDEANIYQLNYDGFEDKAAQFNLGRDLGMGAGYLTLRQTDQLISFYTFSSGAFSLHQKDILTGATYVYPNFYSTTEERSIVWGTNTDEWVYLGLYKPKGSTNLTLRSIQLPSLQAFDTTLEFNIEKLYQPLLHQEKLYITYKTGTGSFKIAVFNTNNNAVDQVLELGPTAPGIFITHAGDLAVLTLGALNRVNLELRSTETLLPIREQNLQLTQNFGPGPVNAQLIGNRLYYQFEYQQPFTLAQGPAIYDLELNENTILDLAGILEELATQENIAPKTVTAAFNVKANAFLISYANTKAPDQVQGGALAISPNGKLLKHLQLPFVPTYFVD